ncbi:MAG: hypothetical protein U5J83_02300 [Bryobacterales bacterium]|nr:hypothetical protein [Bryobacterales bacterium]
MADSEVFLQHFVAFMNKGWSVNKARKLTLLICALIILPVSFVAITDIKWLAIFLIGLGLPDTRHGLQIYLHSYLTYSLKKATASVVGIGGMVGAVAGILGDKALGSV